MALDTVKNMKPTAIQSLSVSPERNIICAMPGSVGLSVKCGAEVVLE